MNINVHSKIKKLLKDGISKVKDFVSKSETVELVLETGENIKFTVHRYEDKDIVSIIVIDSSILSKVIKKDKEFKISYDLLKELDVTIKK